jgi:hypothetical protein
MATCRCAAWPDRGGPVGLWFHGRVAGPACARWAGYDPAGDGMRQHAADYRYLGGDHRSRSASARQQAAGRMIHRASDPRRSGHVLMRGWGRCRVGLPGLFHWPGWPLLARDRYPSRERSRYDAGSGTSGRHRDEATKLASERLRGQVRRMWLWTSTIPGSRAPPVSSLGSVIGKLSGLLGSEESAAICSFVTPNPPVPAGALGESLLSAAHLGQLDGLPHRADRG